MQFRDLLSKAEQTVKVKFLGSNIDVKKLSVADVEKFQSRLKEVKDEESEGLGLQRDIIRMGVVGAEDMTDDELNQFPLDDLSRLAEEVLRAAGVKGDSGNSN